MVFTLEFPEPQRKAPGVGAALGGAGWGRSARPAWTLKGVATLRGAHRQGQVPPPRSEVLAGV